MQLAPIALLMISGSQHQSAIGLFSYGADAAQVVTASVIAGSRCLAADSSEINGRFKWQMN